MRHQDRSGPKPSSSWRRAATGLIAVVTVACVQPVGPARTYHDFELKAESTAKTVGSAVETALLATSIATKHDAFPPYVSVLLSEAEKDGANAQGTFEGIQPPDRHADRIRARLVGILDSANAILSQLRIEARRAQLERLAATARPLPKLSKRLQAFAAAHE